MASRGDFTSSLCAGQKAGRGYIWKKSIFWSSNPVFRYHNLFHTEEMNRTRAIQGWSQGVTQLIPIQQTVFLLRESFRFSRFPTIMGSSSDKTAAVAGGLAGKVTYKSVTELWGHTVVWRDFYHGRGSCYRASILPDIEWAIRDFS